MSNKQGRHYFHSELDMILSSQRGDAKRIKLHKLIDEVHSHAFKKHECDRDGIDQNEEYERFWKEIIEDEEKI